MSTERRGTVPGEPPNDVPGALPDDRRDDPRGEEHRAREAARDALARGRAEVATGSIERAWLACCEAADLGRRLGDGALLADAATTIVGPFFASGPLTLARQALCLEALALLDDSDDARRTRVESQLRAISTGWAEEPRLPAGVPVAADADDRFVALHAEHAECTGPGRALDRLDVADRVRELARPSGRDDQLAWASLWRMDALAQLGRRIELDAEFLELVAVERRLGAPVWRWRVALVRACLSLLDGHVDDVPELAAEARRLGGEAGVEEAVFLDLVLRSDLARRTGEHLAEVESEVRHALADAPFFAQSWRAQLLVRLGRTEEALEIWRALAPHVGDVPPSAVEWLVATSAHAELSVLAADSAAAQRIYEMLLPFAGQHCMPVAMAPYGGPVSLVLGRLAAFLARPATARRHLADAVAESESVHAPWFSRAARQALSSLGEDDSPLSPREAQVAELVTAGLTNREIAVRLFLSERTVENHVSSVLRRLQVPNRAAVAARMSRRR